MGEHLLCKQGVVGSNPTVSIPFRAVGVRGVCCACDGAAVTVDDLVCCVPKRDVATLPKPAHVALSGILEREPGDVLGVHVLSHGEDDQLLCV